MGACFCTGACRVAGRCPNMIENMGQPIEWPKIIPSVVYPEPKKNGYFEPIPKIDICRDPEHNPPTHIYIPPDQQYVHICPSCRRQTIMRGPDVSWSVRTTANTSDK